MHWNPSSKMHDQEDHYGKRVLRKIALSSNYVQHSSVQLCVEHPEWNWGQNPRHIVHCEVSGGKKTCLCDMFRNLWLGNWRLLFSKWWAFKTELRLFKTNMQHSGIASNTLRFSDFSNGVIFGLLSRTVFM